MAFRTFIYLDKDKVCEYLDALSNQSVLKNSKKMLKGRMNAGVAGLEAGIEIPVASDDALSPAAAYNKLETELSTRLGDDYFDLLEDDYDASTLPPLSLFRCLGGIEIPESFDTLAVMSQFLPYLKAAGAISFDDNPDTSDLALSFFEQANADIPVLITLEDITISSKLKSDSFVDADYQTLEDMEEEEVFALCKVHSYLRKDKVVIFDPAKDFLKLNRTLRRGLGEQKGFDPIVVSGPILKAEVIAVYH